MPLKFTTTWAKKSGDACTDNRDALRDVYLPQGCLAENDQKRWEKETEEIAQNKCL